MFNTKSKRNKNKYCLTESGKSENKNSTENLHDDTKLIVVLNERLDDVLPREIFKVIRKLTQNNAIKNRSCTRMTCWCNKQRVY